MSKCAYWLHNTVESNDCSVLILFVSQILFHVGGRQRQCKYKRPFFLSCLLSLSHSKQISKTSSWPIEEAYPWLLVLLTDLDKANQDKLAGAVQLMLEDDLKIIRNTTLETISKPTPMSIYIWLPSRWLLRSISQQGTHQDSISNIHALAVMAFRSGFP